MKRIIIMMACGFCLLQAIFAQSDIAAPGLKFPSDADYQAPLDIDLFLAGNYGELRPNHFHAGLDFKTQGSIGFPVYSIADGYVHRVGINAYGYGLVVYVRHPQLGVTSVYAHLSAFADTILHNVRAKQVELEKNNANITFAPGEVPVSKGMIIAKSGNTGSSAGPHVHFELRNCNDDDDTYYDPMPLYMDKIVDTKPPRIEQVYIYPLGGTVMGGTQRRQAGIVRQPDGNQNLTKTFTAWGRIGLGIKAYDHMDGQANTYGVKQVKLYLGDSLIYSFAEHEFRHSEQRFTNSVIDYGAWQSHRSVIMKSFIEPGNHLQMLDARLGDGTVVIDQERLYPFRYELSDAHGNQTEFSFNVKGVHREAPAEKAIQGFPYDPSEKLIIDTLGCMLELNPGTLYSKTGVTVRTAKEEKETPSHFGPIIQIGSASIPVHSYFDFSMKVPAEVLDTLRNPQQLYLVNLDGGYIGGKYEHGRLKASIREFGRMTIRRDASLPTASFTQLTWNKAQLSISDTGSGISQFKVWIDDKFVPFDMDNRGRYFGAPRHFGIQKGVQHKIRIWLIDRCGNENVIETTRKF